MQQSSVHKGELKIDKEKLTRDTIVIETMRIREKEFVVHVQTTPGRCQLEAITIAPKTAADGRLDIGGCVTIIGARNPASGKSFLFYDSPTSGAVKLAKTRICQREIEEDFLSDGQLTMVFDLRVSSRMLPTVACVPDVKKLIRKVLAPHNTGKECPLTSDEVDFVCAAAGRLILHQPVILFLGAPVNICGDIHGMFGDLLDIFLENGFPGKANYLFLGNLVDVGSDGVDVVLLLLMFKILYPENVFILRGNHECDFATVRTGVEFKTECQTKGLKYQSFLDVFACLPIAAVISDDIFCVHGGLSPLLSQIACVNFKRPQQTPGGGMVSDMIWSDFNRTVEHFEENKRGCLVGPAAVKKFLTSSSLKLIVRGRTHVPSDDKQVDGFEFTLDNVITLSSSGVCGAVNPYALMHVKGDRSYTVELRTPLTGERESSILQNDFGPHLPF